MPLFQFHRSTSEFHDTSGDVRNGGELGCLFIPAFLSYFNQFEGICRRVCIVVLCRHCSRICGVKNVDSCLCRKVCASASPKGSASEEMQQRKEESRKTEELLPYTKKTIAPEETTTMITPRALPEIHRTIRKADMVAGVRMEFIQLATSSSPTAPLREEDRVAG